MLIDAFLLLDAALPYLLIPVALLILTSNFATRRFLEAAGFSLRMRQATGWFLVAASVAMLTGITSCHATTLIIMLLALITVTAWRRGHQPQAFGSAVTACLLVPTIVIAS